MRYALTLLLWLPMGATAAAQIALPEKVVEHRPIEAGCNCILPDGNVSAMFLWDVDSPLAMLPASTDGRLIHLWGPPGKYAVAVTVIIIDWEAKSLTNQAYATTFEIIADKPTPPGPGPDPEPEPDPSDFAGKVAAALAKVPQGDRTKQVRVVQPDGNTVTMPANAAIAKNYLEVAQEASGNPSAWDVATMMDEVKQRNQTVPVDTLRAWTPFFAALAQALRDEDLDTMAKTIELFRTIGEVVGK